MAIFTLSSSGESADLQVLIDGMNVGRSASCTGENVTYVCNITAVVHTWRISGSPTIAVSSTPQVIDKRYTLRIVSLNDLVSSVSVTSFDGLSGVYLTCTDGRPVNPPTQEAVAMVLGKYNV